MLAAGGGLGCPEGHDRAARRDRHLRADRLRQVRRRRARRGASRNGSRLGRCVAGLSRAADPHQPAGVADAAGGDQGSHGGDVRRRVCEARARSGGRPRRTERRSGGLGRDGLVPARRPRRPGGSEPPRSECNEHASKRHTTPTPPRRTLGSPRSIPVRQKSCTRTTGVGSFARSSWQKPEARWCPRSTDSGRKSSDGRRSCSVSTFRPTFSNAVSAHERKRCSGEGSSRRCAPRARGSFRAPPRRHWG